MGATSAEIGAIGNVESERYLRALHQNSYSTRSYSTRAIVRRSPRWKDAFPFVVSKGFPEIYIQEGEEGGQVV